MTLRVHVSGLFRAVVAVLAAASVAAYCAYGRDHPYLDPLSIGLILVFGAVLYACSGGIARRHPPVMIITLPLILFVQLRLLVLILIPDSLLHSDHVTSEMINVTLGYMIAGAIACYAGVALGYGKVKATKSQDNVAVSRSDARFKIVSAAFFALFAFACLDYFVYGYTGATGDGSHLGFFQRYFARLINPQTVFIMAVTAYLVRFNRKRYGGLFVAILILYGAGFIFRGSRSGVFEIVTFLLGAKIIVDNDFTIRINLTRTILSGAVIAVSILGYILATNMRGRWYGEDAPAFLSTNNLNGNGASVSPWRDLASGISYRLSFLEPTLFPAFAEKLELNDVSGLVNVRTTVLSSINRLVPGKPFGDILFSEYAYGYIYNATSGVLVVSADGRIDHVGYEWSMFGISYQLFGYVGGVLFIFGFSALLACIMRQCRDWGGYVALAYGVFLSTVLAAWVRTLGLDNLIDGAAHNLILLLIYVVGFRCIRKIAASMPRQGRPGTGLAQDRGSGDILPAVASNH
jgi:hypothetical protein